MIYFLRTSVGRAELNEVDSVLGVCVVTGNSRPVVTQCLVVNRCEHS